MKKGIIGMPSRIPTAPQLDHPPSASPVTVLSELFELLEEYGPAWYSEEHHKRVRAVLDGRQPTAVSRQLVLDKAEF
jgi:hypothetical protein